ncbi:MAG: hypothetical protein IH884_04760 [Myxococcales bacterium]|nr:hypothetical protein [Myxococcales bacterium]
MDRHRDSRSLLIGPLVAALLFLPFLSAEPAGAQTSGDDLFLLTTSVSPNVIILMDNSESMLHIEWHPAFDPDAGSYGCADFTNKTLYTYDSDATETHCGNTRDIFGPVTGTIWLGSYLNWYFSDAADAYEVEIQTAKALVEGCTQQSAAKFFDDKYRRTRLEATKQVLIDLLCLAEPRNVRFGLAKFRDNSSGDGVDPNGGFIETDLGRANPNHANELEAAIKNSTTVEEGPLGETLFQIMTFWMSRDIADIPLGKDGLTKFPAYLYDKFGNWEAGNSNKWLEDGFVLECEKAFVIIVTDGDPTRDDFDTHPTDTDQGFGDFKDKLIGDYHVDGQVEEKGNSDETAYYMDDIALWAQDNDMRPDLNGDQHVDTYTIGFATGQGPSNFLEKTAEVGNGLFFHVKDGDGLAFALIAALNDIIEKTASFTAAAVPSARTADGGDFYQSFFLPSGRTAAWEGHVRAWRIAANGDILDKNGDCALIDPDAGECNSGPFNPDAVFFWDAYDAIPKPDSRTLYTSKLVSGLSTLVDFDENLTHDDLVVADFSVPPDQAPNSVLYAVQGSTANIEEGLSDEIVEFARGCFFGTGVENSTVDTPVKCAKRLNRLGDIFHSTPIVVRKPSSTFSDPSYKEFRDHYNKRDRVIYAGTNTGFMEAINAGKWDVALDPPAYTAGTGQEKFGFMPWQPRQNIKALPIDDPTARSHYVDGAPQVADVWHYPSATTTLKAANGSEWRTMLVAGLRRGGRHYFALDITNPNDKAGPGGITLSYPGFEAFGPAYGWEFPPENDPDSYLDIMGFTWSKPIITRVRVQVNNDGVAHERWVAIVAGGYDLTSDPNPTEVTGKVSVYDVTSRLGRAILMIDMKTGEPLAVKKFDAAATGDEKYMQFAMPSRPAVLDLNNDGYADLVYVGDMGGQVFKWVIGPLGGDPVNGSAVSDDVAQPNWPFRRFFTAPVLDDAGTLYYQNLFHAPAAAYVGGKLYVAFGAGERIELNYEGDASLDENNRFYVVSDPDPLEIASPVIPMATETDLIDATSSPGGVSITTGRGFFIKAVDGEKFVVNPVIFAGQVVTASFAPTNSADPCAARGIATAYVFDVLNGAGFFVDGGGNPIRTISIGVGVPADPTVSVGPGGGDNRVYIEKSGGEIDSFGVQDIDAGGKLLYWREVD